MDDEERFARARTFDAIAELYDSARPYYREELFDTLFAYAGIAPHDACILEVGPGTGHATESLARRGAEILGIELGENLATVARRKLASFPRVRIVSANFETWEPEGVFDIVFAATAWHWIDPKRRYELAARALKPGGVLAFTLATHAFPPDVDPFFIDIHEAYKAIGMPWKGTFPPPPPEELPDQRDEIVASGLFDDVKAMRWLWTTEYDADSHIALMSTASDHRLLEEAKREYLFSEMRRLTNARPGGRITKHELMSLHLARKR